MISILKKSAFIIAMFALAIALTLCFVLAPSEELTAAAYDGEGVEEPVLLINGETDTSVLKVSVGVAPSSETSLLTKLFYRLYT